jgi:hypothetical protein
MRSSVFGLVKSIVNASPPCGLSSTPENVTTTADAESSGASVMPRVRAPVSEPESSPLPQPPMASAAILVSNSTRRGLNVVMSVTSRRAGHPDARKVPPLSKCRRNWVTFALALVFALP